MGDVSLEQSRGVVKRFAAAFVAIDEADEERGAADLFVQPLHHLEYFRGTKRDLKTSPAADNR